MLLSNKNINKIFLPELDLPKYLENSLISIVQNCEEYKLFYQKKFNRKLQKYTKIIESKKSNSFIETNNWRKKTSLPIVKSYYMHSLNLSNQFFSFQVFNQHCPLRLADLSQIPISQALYLLKQSIIGFERLFEKFGSFIPTAKMVAINQNSKCKVWMNQTFGENDYQPANLSIQQFLQRIIELFSEKISVSDLTEQFLKTIKKQKNLVRVLRLIDSFSLQKMLSIPLKFDLKSSKLERCSNFNENILNFKTSRTSINFKDSIKFKNQKEHQRLVSWAVESAYVPIKELSPSKTPNYTNGDLMNIFRDHSPKPSTKSTYQDKVHTPTSQTKSANTPNTIRKLWKEQYLDEFFIKQQNNPQKKLLKKSSANSYCSKHNLDKKSTFEEDSQNYSIDPFLAKNGWEKKFDGLLNDSKLKQSIIDGNDIIQSQKSGIRLLRLQSLGGTLTKSILTGDQEY